MRSCAVGEGTLNTLSAEERGWLRARLRARLADDMPARDGATATEFIEQEVAALLSDLLARRGGEPQPAPAAGYAHERDPRRRVVITGLGVISCLGHSVADYWDNVVHGRSGITFIENFDAANYPTRFAGEIKRWDPTPWISGRE